MTQSSGESNAHRVGGVSVRFDVPSVDHSQWSTTKNSLPEQKLNKSSTEYIWNNSSPCDVPDRGQDSNALPKDSFSIVLDGFSGTNRSTLSEMTFFGKGLGSSKTVDIPYADVAKLNSIEFDESVYRQDSSKSDEEFLDRSFLDDLEKRMRDRDKQMEKRRKTKLNELRETTILDPNVFEKSFHDRESNIAEEARENIVQEVLGRRDELPVLQGFLEKLSPAVHSRWQRRWVVVVDFTIFYFRD